MCANTPSKDIRTLGYVLRRTDYGEADRILNLITPVGKIAAIAKGVRRPKSKLASGVEMLTLTDFNLHQGKSDFAIVTGVKIVRHYSNILKDFARLELAGTILKRINMAAEGTDTEEFFKITDACLKELDAGNNMELVESWFWLNLLRVSGEEVNLYRDVEGAKLAVDARYNWDAIEMAFRMHSEGDFGANEIKMLRLMLTTDFTVLNRVKVSGEMLGKILKLAKIVAKIS